MRWIRTFDRVMDEHRRNLHQLEQSFSWKAEMSFGPVNKDTGSCLVPPVFGETGLCTFFVNQIASKRMLRHTDQGEGTGFGKLLRTILDSSGLVYTVPLQHTLLPVSISSNTGQPFQNKLACSLNDPETGALGPKQPIWQAELRAASKLHADMEQWKHLSGILQCGLAVLDQNHKHRVVDHIIM
ncbi:hypothetical protein UY3_01256 [Chelonia mydas]|uniref:Uncharacterized protein n=1 Tax=Chelonia mydas TaxID=8469 RepID=M7CA22_CHEMY|nr:hypothetical protein UY3_01256 [Chelonia mydas]